MTLTPDEQQAVAELRTIPDLVRWGASHFNAAAIDFGHGSDNAIDEALFLVLHVLKLKSGLAPELMQGRLTQLERQRIVELFHRRVEERIPVAYLAQEAWFAGLSFYVDERVLVPRSPIAELIANHFSPWVQEGEVFNVLDLCTGSACIAIACAMAFPEAGVDAVDISPEALEVARINVERLQVEGQVEVIESDLFAALEGRRYDLIVSNPPYVDAFDLDSMPDEFHHEPRLGLEAGDDGLDVVVRMLAQASDYLTENGVLVVEVGNSEDALVARFPDVPFTWLAFEHGGHGVFLIQADELAVYRDQFQAACRG